MELRLRTLKLLFVSQVMFRRLCDSTAVPNYFSSAQQVRDFSLAANSNKFRIWHLAKWISLKKIRMTFQNVRKSRKFRFRKVDFKCSNTPDNVVLSQTRSKENVEKVYIMTMTRHLDQPGPYCNQISQFWKNGQFCHTNFKENRNLPDSLKYQFNVCETLLTSKCFECLFAFLPKKWFSR